MLAETVGCAAHNTFCGSQINTEQSRRCAAPRSLEGRRAPVIPCARSRPTTSSWIELAFLARKFKVLPWTATALHVEVGVALLPLGEAAVKLSLRQPVTVGDGVAVVNVGEA